MSKDNDSLAVRVHREMRIITGDPNVRRPTRAELALFEDDPVYVSPYDIANEICDRRSTVLPAATDAQVTDPLLGEQIADFNWARSLVIAADARQVPAVAAFRAEVLGDLVLDEPDIESWVKQRAAAEGPATAFVEVALPDGWRDKERLSVRLQTASLRPTFRYLRYPAFGPREPAGDGVIVLPGTGYQPVRVGGELHRLYELAERLSVDFGWSPAQAVVFVLTDRVPIARLLTTRVTRLGRHPRLATTKQIELVVDAEISPADLAPILHRLRDTADGLTAPDSAPAARRRRLPDRQSLKALIYYLERQPARYVDVHRRWRQEDDAGDGDDHAFRQTVRNAHRRLFTSPPRLEAVESDS